MVREYQSLTTKLGFKKPSKPYSDEYHFHLTLYKEGKKKKTDGSKGVSLVMWIIGKNTFVFSR